MSVVPLSSSVVFDRQHVALAANRRTSKSLWSDFERRWSSAWHFTPRLPDISRNIEGKLSLASLSLGSLNKLAWTEPETMEFGSEDEEKLTNART